MQSAFSGDAAPEVDADSLKAALQRTFSSPTYKPPTLPAVAMEVMQLASRPNVKFEDVVKVLEQDPVMAARVLSISQSAAYAARSPTLSLHQAAVRLGLKTLRDLVLEAALSVKVFRAPGYDEVMARLYRHSTATAHVTRAVCARSLVNDEYAFLCGLLHDIGFAAALLVVAETPEWRRLPFTTLAPVLDELHVEASGALAQRWKLPDPIRRVVERHHEVVVNGKPQPVNAALLIAEQLSWEAGAGMLPPPEEATAMSMDTPEPPIEGFDVNSTVAVEEARRALKMDELGLATARAEAFEIVANLGKGA